VVEVQGAYAPVIAAERAATSRLGDQDLLHTPATVRDALPAAQHAAQMILRRVRDEPRQPVGRADALGFPLAVAGTPGAGRLETELAQPVTYRRLAPAHLGCDLARAEPSLDESFEHLALQSAARRMARGVLRGQSVLAHPVPDGRRVAADVAGDRLGRPP